MMILAIDQNGKQKCCYTDPVGSPVSIYDSKEKKKKWLNEKRRFCESNLSLIKEWIDKGYQIIEIQSYYGCEDLPLKEKREKMGELKLLKCDCCYSNGNLKEIFYKKNRELDIEHEKLIEFVEEIAELEKKWILTTEIERLRNTKKCKEQDIYQKYGESTHTGESLYNDNPTESYIIKEQLKEKISEFKKNNGYLEENFLFIEAIWKALL